MSAFLSLQAQAQVTEMHFIWHELPANEVMRECTKDFSIKERMKFVLGNSDIAKHIYGCHENIDGVEHIYVTRLEDSKNECMYMETIGHEVRHLRDGAWHGTGNVKQTSWCVSGEDKNEQSSN